MERREPPTWHAFILHVLQSTRSCKRSSSRNESVYGDLGAFYPCSTLICSGPRTINDTLLDLLGVLVHYHTKLFFALVRIDFSLLPKTNCIRVRLFGAHQSSTAAFTPAGLNKAVLFFHAFFPKVHVNACRKQHRLRCSLSQTVRHFVAPSSFLKTGNPHTWLMHRLKW